MKKILLLISVLGMFLLTNNVYADSITNGNLDVSINESKICPNAKSAILFESKTNSLLYEQDMNLRLPPASMTKIMTLLLIYEAIEKNIISKNTIITVSENAKNVEGSKAFLSVGEIITIDEILKCISIASANDAAIAAAEAICGSEESFVEKMNIKTKELGLKNTLFSDCTGLSSKNHYTSAYDMAIIADALIDKFPDVLNYTNIKEDYIRKDSNKPFWLVNTNKLLGHVKGLNGLKTGYTSFSGYCITLHMDKNGLSLISVVMGYKDSKMRNNESLKLLNYGANNYEIKTIYKKGEIVKVFNSCLYKNSVSLRVNKDVCYLYKKGEAVDIKKELYYNLGDLECGYISIYADDKLMDTVNLYTDDKIIKLNIFQLMFNIMINVFK